MKFRFTDTRTSEHFSFADIPHIAARLVVYGEIPEHYIVEKLLDTGEWTVVDLKGKEMYQIEKELKEN